MTVIRQSFNLRHIADIWLKTTDLTKSVVRPNLALVAIAWHSKWLMAVALLAQAKNIPQWVFYFALTMH